MMSENFNYFRKTIKMTLHKIEWNYFNIAVLEISMYDFVDRDGPLDDNEPIHKS